jgi:hypothetical protein
MSENGGHEVPNRLEDALRYAIFRVEENPRTAELIVRFLGWGGDRFLQAPAELGEPVEVARQRVKDAADRALTRLQEERLVPEAVERVMALIETSLPILDVELWGALLEARLCFIRLSCEAVNRSLLVAHRPERRRAGW